MIAETLDNKYKLNYLPLEEQGHLNISNVSNNQDKIAKLVFKLYMNLYLSNMSLKVIITLTRQTFKKE